MTPAYSAQPAPQPPKRMGLLGWMLIGVSTMFALIIIGALVLGAFVVHKVKEAGVSAELMRKNPALAVTRLMAAVDPHIEVLSVNEDNGTVRVRNRESGKTYTVDLERAKRGDFHMRAGDAEIALHSDGNTGALTVRGGDGSRVSIGGGPAEVPSWIPNYPGSRPMNAVAAKEAGSNHGMFSFQTDDRPEHVLNFYRDRFTGAHLNVTNEPEYGSRSLSVADASDTREAKVTAVRDGTQTDVVVIYSRN